MILVYILRSFQYCRTAKGNPPVTFAIAACETQNVNVSVLPSFGLSEGSSTTAKGMWSKMVKVLIAPVFFLGFFLNDPFHYFKYFWWKYTGLVLIEVVICFLRMGNLTRRISILDLACPHRLERHYVLLLQLPCGLSPMENALLHLVLHGRLQKWSLWKVALSTGNQFVREIF